MKAIKSVPQKLRCKPWHLHDSNSAGHAGNNWLRMRQSVHDDVLSCNLYRREREEHSV